MDGFLNKIGHNPKAFTSMFDFIKDLVFLMEVDGNSLRYIYVNQSAATVLASTKEVIGSKIEDIVPEDLATLLIKKYKEALVSRKPLNFEGTFPTANGEFIGETSLNPILTEHKQCKYVLAIVRDITDRRLREKEQIEMKRELLKNQEKMNSLIENNSDAVFELDVEGHFIGINKIVTTITGYEENELIGQPYNLLLVEEYDKLASYHFKKVLAGLKEEFELWIRRKDGRRVHLFVRNIPIIVDDEVVGMYGMAADITDLRRAERQLRQSEEKFRLISENAFDIIKLINPTRMVEYVSPSIERIVGYSPAEYIGQLYTSDIHPDDTQNVERKFQQLIDQAQPTTLEFRILHKEGYHLWLETTMTPIIEDDEIKQVLAIARDITERKRFRDELAKMAFYDYLTGLPNRRILNDRLDMAIHQATRSNKKFAVMMIDGRDFKKINDTYGHDAGDAVIKEMANRLQKCIRQTDTVARLGGDEMAIIISELDSEEVAIDIAERIIETFRTPLYFNDNEIKIGAGIGISFYPNHSLYKKQLVKFADEALYVAKESDTSVYKIFGQ